MAKQAVKSKLVAQKGSYKLWTTSDNKLGLKAAVNAVFAGEDLTTAAQKNVSSILIPRQTLDHAMQKETARQDGLIETNKSVDDVLFDCNAKSAIKWDSLTTPEFQKELQSIIFTRNNLNNSITQKEVIL